MTRIEELDAVLRHMQNLPLKYTYHYEVVAELNNKGILIPVDHLKAILHKLLDDGYISDNKELVRTKKMDGVPLIWIDEPIYVLTWEGTYFYEEGGYAVERSRAELDDSSKRKMVKSAHNINRWVAIGTCGLLLLEILKWSLPHLYSFFCLCGK